MMRASTEPMTLDQLKRHMDRRFDRLERTKADRGDLRRFITRREFRQEIRRLASKDELRRLTNKFATKFATKDDLKRFATKEDLKRFATKEDLKRFATKDDLNDLRRYMLVLNQRTRDEIQRGVKKISDAVGHHALVLDNHEDRIQDLESR